MCKLSYFVRFSWRTLCNLRMWLFHNASRSLYLHRSYIFAAENRQYCCCHYHYYWQPIGSIWSSSSSSASSWSSSWSLSVAVVAAEVAVAVVVVAVGVGVRLLRRRSRTWMKSTKLMKLMKLSSLTTFSDLSIGSCMKKDGEDDDERWYCLGC